MIKVWDMNWDAVRLFLAMATQWRVVGLTTLDRARIVRTGLDYAALPAVRGELGIRRSDMLFAQLQVLERTALGEFAKAGS